MTNRGLFIDFDGTLADNQDVMWNIYLGFLEKYSCQGSKEEFDRLNGPPITQGLEKLKLDHNLDESLEHLIDSYNAQIDLNMEVVAPSRNVVIVLEKARQCDWTICLVTSNQVERVQSWLKRQRLDSYIDAIIGAESVSDWKPHPAPYLFALESCKCGPQLSIAVDDSQHGTQSASAAGIRTFGYNANLALSCHWPAGVEGIDDLDKLLPILELPANRAVHAAGKHV